MEQLKCMRKFAELGTGTHKNPFLGGDLIKYILQRLLILPVLMFLVTSILFLVVLQLPVEQRAQVYLPSVKPNLKPEEMQQLIEHTIERYGLDAPFLVQYANWLRNLFIGQWGFSPTWRQSVLEGLRQRAPATLELTIFAMVPSVILAVILGSLSARHQNGIPDYIVRTTAFIGWAFPPFILGLILMNVFYAWSGWFPPQRLSIWATFLVRSEDFHTFTGMYTVDALLNSNSKLFWDAVRHLVLPGVTLAVVQWALLTRVMRSSVLGVLKQDYVITARAKGLRERHVINRHVHRNAILPLISLTSVAASMFITNIVIIEVIFNINGIGRWAARSILQADVPVAVGFALFSCTLTVAASLIADILYAVVDPQVRLY